MNLLVPPVVGRHELGVSEQSLPVAFGLRLVQQIADLLVELPHLRQVAFDQFVVHFESVVFLVQLGAVLPDGLLLLSEEGFSDGDPWELGFVGQWGWWQQVLDWFQRDLVPSGLVLSCVRWLH